MRNTDDVLYSHVRLDITKSQCLKSSITSHYKNDEKGPNQDPTANFLFHLSMAEHVNLALVMNVIQSTHTRWVRASFIPKTGVIHLRASPPCTFAKYSIQSTNAPRHRSIERVGFRSECI